MNTKNLLHSKKPGTTQKQANIICKLAQVEKAS